MRAAQEKPVVRFIGRLRETGGLDGTDLANFTGVSKPTVSRWMTGQRSPHPKTQRLMSDLACVVLRLSEHYTDDEIHTWLHARHPQLDGQRAIDLVRDERSEEVLAIVDRLDADAYL